MHVAPHIRFGGRHTPASVPTHRLVKHTSPVAHRVPHAPQLRTSDVTSVQNPAQSIDGAAHIVDPMHLPAVQVCPAVQTVPHAPQFSRSVCMSTHAVPHIVLGALHGTPLSITPPIVQWLDSHSPFGGLHRAPHCPQFAGSDVRSTHAAPHAASGRMHPVPPSVARAGTNSEK